MTSTIPRWRGFNLIDLFSTSVRWKEFFPLADGLVREHDFEMIRELGFNLVRLPVSYLFLGQGKRARTPDPLRLALVDRAVEFGRKHNVHVVLNMHRAPGYCVLGESQYDFPEADDLFTDDDALGDFLAWWRAFAEHYRDVPPTDLSFDLLNEPLNLTAEAFNRTFIPAIETIRAVDPARWIHVEGTFNVNATFDSIRLVPPTRAVVEIPNVISSLHLYHPPGLTHFNVPWSPHSADFEAPTWPYRARLRAQAKERELTGDNARLWDKAAIRDLLAPYLALAAEGHPVHVGEMGAYSAVPHDVSLRYFTDVVDVLNEHRIGYALWNLRGPFGIMDSGRTDTPHEDFHGHRLDRQLVELLARE